MMPTVTPCTGWRRCNLLGAVPGARDDAISSAIFLFPEDDPVPSVPRWLLRSTPGSLLRRSALQHLPDHRLVLRTIVLLADSLHRIVAQALPQRRVAIQQ